MVTSPIPADRLHDPRKIQSRCPWLNCQPEALLDIFPRMRNAPAAVFPLAFLVFMGVACGPASSGGTGGAPGLGGSGSAGGSGSTGGSVGTGGNASTGGGPAAGGAVGSGGTGSGGRTGTGGTAGTSSGGATEGGGRGGNGGAGAGGRMGAGGHTGAWRIMPLGDSTTQSTCWRAMLWQQLNQSGRTGMFDFVGSAKNSSDPTGTACTPANADSDNEGHNSCLVTEITSNTTRAACNVVMTSLMPSLTTDRADIVLMHFGTNDVWNSAAPTTILSAYTTMLNALRQVNPNVVVVVAQIIPLVPVNTTTCTTCACPTACDQRAATLNGMIPAWATTNSTAQSPIVVVDQHAGWDSVADTVDGIHPNASGSMKMATKWTAAISQIF
jgi:lysophospholipase L1-like esterase